MSPQKLYWRLRAASSYLLPGAIRLYDTESIRRLVEEGGLSPLFGQEVLITHEDLLYTRTRVATGLQGFAVWRKRAWPR